MTEEWRPVPDWEERYEVSSVGNIRVARTGKLRFTWPIAGYRYVRLYRGTAGTNLRIHRLVCRAFLGAPPSADHEVHHKNHVRDDNRVENLEWVTKSENSNYRIATGSGRGERHPRSKFTEAQVLEMRARAATGEKYPPIAKDMGTTPQAVCLIVKRKLWRHI